MKSTHIVGKLDGKLVVVSNQGIQPIAVLEKYQIENPSDSRMIIGIRFWDAEWELWDYRILAVEEGVDVSRFFERA